MPSQPKPNLRRKNHFDRNRATDNASQPTPGYQFSSPNQISTNFTTTTPNTFQPNAPTLSQPGWLVPATPGSQNVAIATQPSPAMTAVTTPMGQGQLAPTFFPQLPQPTAYTWNQNYQNPLLQPPSPAPPAISSAPSPAVAPLALPQSTPPSPFTAPMFSGSPSPGFGSPAPTTPISWTSPPPSTTTPFSTFCGASPAFSHTTTSSGLPFSFSPFSMNSSGGFSIPSQNQSPQPATGPGTPAPAPGLESLPHSNLPFYVPVPPPLIQNLTQNPSPWWPPQQPKPEYICVTPFRELGGLPYSKEFLAAKQEQVRVKLNESIKQDEAKAKIEKEKKSKPIIRSYVIPSENEHEKILANHAYILRNFLMKNKLMLQQNGMKPSAGDIGDGKGPAGKPDFQFLFEKYHKQMHATNPGLSQGSQNVEEIQRAKRTWNLISSMDERMVRKVKEESQKSRSNQEGRQQLQKTRWARLDMSVVNTLLEKRCKVGDVQEDDYHDTQSKLTDISKRTIKSGVILKSSLCYCKPSLTELDELTDQSSGSCFVKDFEIGHPMYGKIVFADEFNVAGINLDKIVRFRHGEIQLYYNDQSIPPFGYGLHRPFLATLYGMHPRIRQPESWNDSSSASGLKNMRGEGAGGARVRQSTSVADTIEMYTRVLQQACSRFGGVFLGYDYDTAIWTFKVERLDNEE